MDDLVAFLRARLDEDEAMARAAWGLSWLTDPADREGDSWVINEDMHLCEANDATAAHIARHDPARVLREVEAKRAIVAWYEEQDGWDLPPGVSEGRDDNERQADAAMKVTLLEVAQALAAVYRDHPDYDPA